MDNLDVSDISMYLTKHIHYCYPRFRMYERSDFLVIFGSFLSLKHQISEFRADKKF